MANILGKLLVELGVNMASYTEGMTKASYLAQKTGREIQDSFQKIGGALSGVLGQFGVFGSLAGEAFSKAASGAAKATTEFGKLGNVAGLLGGALGAVASLTVAAGAAALGVAAHSSEGAAKLYELSQATAVNVETLSRYGYIARQSGVDSDIMTKSLERLSKSAYAAAVAPAGAVNVYTRLGIAVKDSSGAMRPVSDIMADLAEKFKEMGPTTERTALAMQIFGRGGAAILPILAEGKDGISKMSAEADAFGVTVSGQTAAAAHAFEQSLDKIKEAGIGVGNQLMVQLLPAMQTVATEFVEALKDPDSGLRSLITTIGVVAKVLLTLGELVVAIFSQVKTVIWGVISGIQESFTGLGHVIWDVLSGRFDLIVDDAKALGHNLKGTFLTTATDSLAVWQDFGHSVGKIFSEAASPAGPIKTAPSKPITGGAVGIAAAVEKDIVEALVNKLEAQARAEQKISDIIAHSSYELAIKKAAAEAELRIDETRNQLLEREKQLEAELVSAKGSKKESGIKSQIENVKRYLEELKTDEPQIRKLFESMASGKEIAAANEALRKQTATVEADAKAFDILAAASFATAAAQREAAAQEAAARYAAENPELATQERLRTVYDNALKQQDMAYEKTILQAAAQEDLNKKYDDEVTKLNDIRAILVANGKDTLVIDAKLYDAQQNINAEWDAAAIKVGNFKKVAAGTLDILSRQAESFGATLSKSVINGVNSATTALSKFLVTGSKVNFKEIGTSISESIMDGILKTGVSKIAGGLLGKLGLGGLLPGNKPDGSSQGQALWVQIAKTGANAGVVGGTVSNIFGGLLDKIGLGSLGAATGAGAPDGTASNPLWVKDASGGSGGGLFGGGGSSDSGGDNGGLMGLLGSIFGGGKAGGGEVFPSKAYLVGEKRPELFVPHTAGSIIPDVTKMNKGAGGIQASVTMHVHGATDADSFRKSSPQVATEIFRQLQMAAAHNGSNI